MQGTRGKMREERSQEAACIGTVLSCDLSVCLPSLGVLDSATNEIVCDSLMNNVVAERFTRIIFIWTANCPICDRSLMSFVAKEFVQSTLIYNRIEETNLL